VGSSPTSSSIIRLSGQEAKASVRKTEDHRFESDLNLQWWYSISVSISACHAEGMGSTPIITANKISIKITYRVNYVIARQKRIPGEIPFKRFRLKVAAYCRVEQWLVRRSHKPKVVSSTLTPATKWAISLSGKIHALHA
jgi:hypothetical protein